MEKVVPHFWIAAVGVVLVFLGLIGPWAKIIGLLSVSVSGLDTDDGKIVAVLALAALAFLALYAFRERKPWPLVAAGLCGVVMTATAVYDLVDISSSVDEVQSEFASASVGWGLYVTVLGGLGVCVGSLLTIIQSRKTPAGEAAKPAEASPESPAGPGGEPNA
jgi:hypothetical protein